MSGFDWEGFFRSEGIEYRTSGKNVKKFWVNICCPQCENDTGYHLGCNPVTGGFACWRDKSHSGRNPAKLVKALKGCSWADAVKITGGDEVLPGAGTVEDMERQAAALNDRPARVTGLRIVKMPASFYLILPRGLTSRCWDHLVSARGFRERDVSDLCDYYQLRYAPVGEWKKRIILPFLHKGGAVVGWQARALGSANIRYISHPKEAADKRLLFNYGPACDGGRVLVVCEGPFDALKVDYYGRRRDIRAVGTLGTSFSEDQVGLLFRLAPRFRRLVILFDPEPEAFAAAFDLQSRLIRFAPIIGNVPEGREDPGAMAPEEVVPCIRDYT